MKTNKTVMIIAIFLLFLVLIGFSLYPHIRYEKDTVGKMDIRYDKFEGIIYTKNSHDRNSEWRPTEFKTMGEAKQRLAEKELEENLEEARKQLQRKQKKGTDFSDRPRYY